jgi:hypothetical protein
MSTKFVIKNDMGYYYGRGEKLDGKWATCLDVDFHNIPLFDSEEEAQDYISKTPFFKDTKTTIGKVCKDYKEINSSDPAVYNFRHKLEEGILNTRGHYDSLVTLLNDKSLSHDMNASCGWALRNLEKEGLKFDTKEAYKYSNMVSANIHRDISGNLLPNKMRNEKNLACKARRLAAVIATLADTLALLDQYEEEANAYKKDIAKK